MVTNTERSLSNVFGIPIEEEDTQSSGSLTVQEESHAELATTDSADTEKEASEIRNDAQEDYALARDNIKRLLEDGEDLLDSAIRIAQSTEDPKAISAANNVLQGLTKLNTSLLDLSQKRQEIVNNSRVKDFIKSQLNTKPQSQSQSDGQTTNIQNVTNNVQFVGTSNDLMEMIKKVKLEQQGS